MVSVARALREAGLDAKIILQVHDELIIEASRESAERAKEILVREMERAVQLCVPLPVDVSVGNTWFEN